MLLILLPVFLLAAFSLHAVRQDRLLVEQEAQERATELARELADRLHEGLAALARNPAAGESVWPVRFDLDAQGGLIVPPHRPDPSSFWPFDFDELGSEARGLWLAAQDEEYRGETAAEVAAAWRRVIEANLPPRWTAAATYNLALALARGSVGAEAAKHWDALSHAPSALVAESGVPFSTLASWQRWRHAVGQAAGGTAGPADRALFAALCSNLVHCPSVLTEPLLDRLAQETNLLTAASQTDLRKWQVRWRRDEVARRLHAGASREWRRLASDGHDLSGVLPMTNGLSSSGRQVWVQVPTGTSGSRVAGTEQERDPSPWLVLCSEEPRLVCHGIPESAIRELASRLIAETPRVPPYFRVSFEAAGKTLLPSLHPVLVRHGALGAAGSSAASWIHASVHLSDPAALFARQRKRTLWLGLLVVFSSGMAVGGLWAAYRAFERQIRLNELKSSFVSAASHELRAPIASVRLLAESLERGKVKEETKRQAYYHLIGQECRRLSNLISNVLDFSRIDQRRKQYDFEPTDVVYLVKHTIELMEPYASERQVRLEFARSPAETRTRPSIDPRAIEQALVNLIDNAIKHAPSGSTVEVRLALGGDAKSSDPPGTDGRGDGSCPALESPPLRLTVSDAGPGIPKADQVRIFEPFYRLGSELRRETPGIGIGLSIVKHVVEAHGGRVWVDSEVGQGSRFNLELPIDRLTEGSP